MAHRLILLCSISLFVLGIWQPSAAQRLMERLDRGLVAIRQENGHVFVGWRLLGTDSQTVAFNLYRKTGSQVRKLNAQPIATSTNYVDSTAAAAEPAAYFVRAVLNGREQTASESAPASALSQPYLTIPLKTRTGYTPNDVSAADLDGDGQYDLVVHQAGRGRDNGAAGATDEPLLEAYKLDGTFLWRINLGKNIREGAHYTQFIVYDLDGDGRAEVACKTADGTIDGRGKPVGDSTKHWVGTDGKIMTGPEYFTIFDGQTGAALATTDYIPSRNPTDGWGGNGGNGGTDNNGNRVDRFLACVAYLDGRLPSVIMCRGYYGRTVLAAWDWRNNKLTSRWVFDSKNRENPFSGMGNHNLTVTDVDADGRDEIVYGSMVVDDTGKGLFSTGLRHGDALHVSDWDPTRPGPEVWGIHENEEKVPGYENGYGAALYEARTGKVIWGAFPGKDVGRGVAADIDPTNPGPEFWWSGGNGTYNLRGERVGNSPPSVNFLAWWDGDLTRELLDGNHIDKYISAAAGTPAGVPAAAETSTARRLLTAEGCSSNNGTKATPALSADLLGDWREEVIFRTNDNQALRLYTTTIPTTYRFTTLMHDPQYRLSIAWQNVGYNQPPHTSFFLGNGMTTPPKPMITVPRVSTN